MRPHGARSLTGFVSIEIELGYVNYCYHVFEAFCRCGYRSPCLQWHCLQCHPAYSDFFGMSRLIGLLLNYLCLQWQSGYSDTFLMSQGCHCKQGPLYSEYREYKRAKLLHCHNLSNTTFKALCLYLRWQSQQSTNTALARIRQHMTLSSRSFTCN